MNQRTIQNQISISGHGIHTGLNTNLTLKPQMEGFGIKFKRIDFNPPVIIDASLDKASEENERNYYKILNTSGENIIVVQIAGLIARRIVNETSENMELKQGDRIGMIRFGSRVDIYFENYNPLVKVNQKTIAGETLLAKK